MRKFNKVQTKHNYWVAETKGDVLEGVVTKKGIEIVTLYGELEVIEITTDEGEILRVSLSAGLKNAIDQVEEGSYIRITYLGNEYNSKTKRKFKSFDVEIAE